MNYVGLSSKNYLWTLNANMKEVVIVAATRTPIGSFGGSLSPLSATQLGGIVIRSVIEKAGLSANDIKEIFMGNVLSANLGQAPATQAAIAAGIPYLPATTMSTRFVHPA